MLNLTNFTLQSQFNNLSRTLINYPIYPQTQISIPSKNPNFINYSYVSSKFPSGFCLNVSNNQRKGENIVEIEKKKQENGEDEEVFSDEEFDDEFVVEDDDEVIIPLKNMKKWMENKPSGFGEGKVYDTLIEDNLMEEIEQSKKAQVVNVNKLKNSNEKEMSKKNEQVKKTTEVEEGYRVRLSNLPKKKNIHKDLRLAFVGVPGLKSIVPAVYGNKKTRDPICKGLAFVNFKSENEALRFVKTFSEQSIAFGKVQKQIKYELLHSAGSIPGHEQSIKTIYSSSRLEVRSIDEIPDVKSETNAPHIEQSEETSSDEEEDVKREHPAEYTTLSAVVEEEKYQISQIDTKPLKSEGNSFSADMKTSGQMEAREEDHVPVPSQSKKQKKIQTNVKGDSARKKEKSSKPTIPGSSKRLRVREKAVLTDVFSKYVPQAALATEERR